MPSIPVLSNVTLPTGDIAQGTDYFVGVDSQGRPSISPGALGVRLPAGLHTWSLQFDTTNSDPTAACTFDILWSIDASQPRLLLPGGSGASFTGGTYQTRRFVGGVQQIVTTGIHSIGDAIQQSPYPTLFIVHVSVCTKPMLLQSLTLETT